jgi:hypothetical protein
VQAFAGGKTPVISKANDQSLFAMTYPNCQGPAKQALSDYTWSQVNPMAKIAVMDMIYATGSVQQNMITPLRDLDYVWAGFRLVDSSRTTVSEYGTLRVKAEYQNLLMASKTELGKII